MRFDRLSAIRSRFRIADVRFPLMSGQGAALVGGRWNSPGVPMIYASETYMGALLEKLAHTNIGMVPKNQAWIRIDFPQGITIGHLSDQDAPGWEQDLGLSRECGDRWVSESRTIALVVPGIVARPHQKNVLINPAHPDFARLVTTDPQPVPWDTRLFQ